MLPVNLSKGGQHSTDRLFHILPENERGETMATNRSFLTGQNVSIYVDASDLQDKIDTCKSVLSRQNFEKLIKRTFNEVGKTAKTLIAKEASKRYQVPQAYVKSGIQNGKIEVGETVTLKIPLKSVKGSIGGRFKLTSASKRGKWIKARIVKGQTSKLPPKMANQGGNPPFILYASKGVQGAKKVGNSEVVFTRRGPNRLPIVAVKGLAVPQMPLNLAADATRERMLETAEKRLESNFKFMFGKK